MLHVWIRHDNMAHSHLRRTLFARATCLDMYIQVIVFWMTKSQKLFSFEWYKSHLRHTLFARATCPSHMCDIPNLYTRKDRIQIYAKEKDFYDLVIQKTSTCATCPILICDMSQNTTSSNGIPPVSDYVFKWNSSRRACPFETEFHLKTRTPGGIPFEDVVFNVDGRKRLRMEFRLEWARTPAHTHTFAGTCVRAYALTHICMCMRNSIIYR